LAAGCTAPGNESLVLQLNYARSKIPDPDTRASVLGTIARSAAAWGDIKTMNAALKDLRGDPSHDDYAAKCAIELHGVGHPADARRVAKEIADPTKRQEVLAKLTAKPKEDDTPKGDIPAILPQ